MKTALDSSMILVQRHIGIIAAVWIFLSSSVLGLIGAMMFAMEFGTLKHGRAITGKPFDAIAVALGFGAVAFGVFLSVVLIRELKNRSRAQLGATASNGQQRPATGDSSTASRRHD